MTKRFLLYILISVIVALQPQQATAQGKNFIRGLQGRDSLSMSRVLVGSLIVPGYGQAYNRQYWKIPVVYGAMGGFIAAGIHFNSKYKDDQRRRDDFYNSMQVNPMQNSHLIYYDIGSNKRNRNLCYFGAAAVYLGSAIDAVAYYKTDKINNPVSPQRATIYSALLPGLGQAYNGEYWKIPIVYAGLGICISWYNQCDTQYKRYRTAYNLKYYHDTEGAAETDEFGGRYSLATLKNARDTQRRNRDMTLLVTGIVYALNIIDANVSAHLRQFDVSDDLSLRVEPTIFNEATLASGNLQPTVGMKLQLKFK